MYGCEICKNKIRFLIVTTVVLFFYYAKSYSQNIAGNYYPLEINNYWSYNSENSRELEEIVVDTLRINEKLYYGISPNRNPQFIRYFIRNVDSKTFILNYSDSTENILFDFDATINSAWELQGFECSFGKQIKIVSSNDTVITEMDTFYNCIHFEHTPNCSDAGYLNTWFAPGIGKVKSGQVTIGGVSYFELRDFELITKTSINDIKLTNDNNEFIIYPNPINNRFRIKPDNSQVTNVVILTHNGTPIKIFSEKHNSLYDLSQFSSGIYFIKICTHNNTSFKMVLKK